MTGPEDVNASVKFPYSLRMTYSSILPQTAMLCPIRLTASLSHSLLAEGSVAILSQETSDVAFMFVMHVRDL